LNQSPHSDHDQPVPCSVSDASPHAKDKRSRSLNRCQEEEHLRAKIKSVKLTVTVILCYVFCSMPFICVQLWARWYPGAQESSLWTG
jgi:hypothetical protein